jgi:G3E family GTPase
VTTVDAVNGAKQLKRNDECRKQAAVADRIVLTKMDMLAEKDCVEDADTLIAQLKRLNPSAPHFDSQKDELTAAKLFTNDVYDPRAKSAEVARWIDAEAFTDGIHAHDDDTGAHAHDNVNRHDGGIHAFCLTFDTPLDWTAFGLWLSALLQNHGEEVLRVKGLLNVVDVAAPVAIHGVQHVVHPPIHLNRWPDSDRRSRIVFIVRDLAEDQIRASLIAFNQLGDIASKQVAA